MKIPSCYTEGIDRASAVDADLTSLYIAHTIVGDPIADALIDELATIEPANAARFVSAGMDQDEAGLVGAPRQLRDFFANLDAVPAWVDFDSYMPGVRMFHRNSPLVLAAFVGAVLIEGFATNIGKSFFITGRVRDSGVKRLRQNNRHMVEVFMPGGLLREGDGWKLSVRIRLVHAKVRHLLRQSEEWDMETYGEPLSAAHLGFSLAAFSARLLRHMKRLGARYDDEERRSFMNIWRYSGYLMGIPESILYRTEEEALKLFEVGCHCEPEPDYESISMANSLINSAPLVVGITDPVERNKLSQYVYKISRALIGSELADHLRYPNQSSVPSSVVLRWFRLEGRYNRFLQRHLPNRSKDSNYANFTGLLNASEFDQKGISYKLPSHVHAERSSEW